jgi:transposase
MTRATRYPPELRERAMRLVREHRDEHTSEWAAIQSVAGKLGMTPETLRLWLRRDAPDHGQRPGAASDERERVRELEREVRELRRANEILRAASVFFARELDPRLPPR